MLDETRSLLLATGTTSSTLSHGAMSCSPRSEWRKPKEALLMSTTTTASGACQLRVSYRSCERKEEKRIAAPDLPDGWLQWSIAKKKLWLREHARAHLPLGATLIDITYEIR